MAPPPPVCLPFGSSSKKPRRYSFASVGRPSMSSSSSYPSYDEPGPQPRHPYGQPSEKDFGRPGPLARHESFSSRSTGSTLTEKMNDNRLTFMTDSENYDMLAELPATKDFQSIGPKGKKGNKSKMKEKEKVVVRQEEVVRPVGADLKRGNTMTGTGKSKWGYGWGAGKKKEVQLADEANPEMSMFEGTLPVYASNGASPGPQRSNSQSTQASRDTQQTYNTMTSGHRSHRSGDLERSASHRTNGTTSTHPLPILHRSGTGRSRDLHRSNTTSSRDPGLSRHTSGRSGRRPSESTSTLVGSTLERKLSDVARADEEEMLLQRVDTTDRLEELRTLMAKEGLGYYIIPSNDAHGSEYVASSDQRRAFMCGFTGSAGECVVTMNQAFLVTDSRYWLQAERQLDGNWELVRAGNGSGRGGVTDWTEFLIDHASAGGPTKIGIDGRMISYATATSLGARLARLPTNPNANPQQSKLVYPIQNLVDFIWKFKPPKSTHPVFIQEIRYAGEASSSKLDRLRDWINSNNTVDVKERDRNVGAIVAHLPSIAWLLNLRGSDIPFNPLFHAYLFVSFDTAVLFCEQSKINTDVQAYLSDLGVRNEGYAEVWSFLRKRPWGEGKLIITPQTSYTIAMVLSHYRVTVLPAPSIASAHLNSPYGFALTAGWIEEQMSKKNERELEGMRKAYLRDGLAFTRFLAWLAHKFTLGYEITEFEAAQRLTEFRRSGGGKYFMGLAYANISASGPNAALPHYSATRKGARAISTTDVYLNDSGGQYIDGTCDTTRTVHLGRPSDEECDAFTRVLMGHIAIDTAVFPEGTSGRQLDVLARRALWKECMDYAHGTGHGVGSFLTVHEGPHGFGIEVPLREGVVITNEPGFYKEGKFGIRIESALIVRKIKTRAGAGNPTGNWLGFERLTCVPIQTRMIKESMLSKEERSWVKEHNQRVHDLLLPKLQEINDKRTIAWLKRETGRGLGLASAVGGVDVDWG